MLKPRALSERPRPQIENIIVMGEMDCDHYQWGQDPDSTGPLGIDYIYLDNCLFPHGHVFIVILMFLWVIFLMNQMATTASDYFSPTLGLVSDKLNLAYDIAGVTFLAFGNGAPDFFAILASVSGGIDILVAMGALLGGEVFISTVVVGSIAILCPCELTKVILYRDLSFFLIAVTTVLIVALMQCIPFWLAIVHIVIYIIYVIIVMVGSWFGGGQDATENRKIVENFSGDIGLTRFDTESIQTAFWHKDAEGDAIKSSTSSNNNNNKTNHNIKPTTTTAFKAPSNKKAEKSGYTFLILDDPDDDADSSKSDTSDRRLESGIINLSGGYEPDFSLIIQDNYCDTIHYNNDYENMEVLRNTGYTVYSDNDGYSNNYEEDDTDVDIDGTTTGSENNLLEERLLSNNSSSTGSNSNNRTKSLLNNHNKKGINMKNKNKTQYQQLLTALYWQQWSFQRRFHTSTIANEWSTYSWWYKICIMIDYPVSTLRDFTIPTLNTANWSKFHAIIHPIIDPLFVCYLFGYINTTVEGIPVYIICLLISILPTAAIYLLTHHNTPPKSPFFTIPWTLTAFIMCVVWIYILAGELITCLSALGRLLAIPPAFLGLTVLAWGNSMGDFFTNTSVAKQGFGDMAIAGCYGGPVFNILMGLNCALALASLQTYPHPYVVKLDAACMLSILFLYISLISTIVIVTMNNYKIERTFGMYLISLYAVYTVCQSLLVAFG